MFRGHDAEVNRVMQQALVSARHLGHLRVGSEHLLLALARDGGISGDLFARHGATPAAIDGARMHPPLGVDAQAVYETSLRLALARRDRQHRREHLALILISLDPGVDWLLRLLGVDRRSLLSDLARSCPSPQRNPVLRATRRLGRRSRGDDLIRRYRRLTGRAPVDGSAVMRLVAG